MIAEEPRAQSRLFVRWSARFADAALEDEFMDEHVRAVLTPHVRVALALGIATFVSYGLHDWLVFDRPAQAWAVRFGMAIPSMLALWALCFTRLFARWHQWVLLAYGLVATSSVLWIAAISERAPSILYASFAALFVTIGPLIARLDVLRQALYTALSALMLLVFELRFSRSARAISGAQLWTLVAMGSLGAVLAWINERQARLSFLAQRTIRAQTEVIERERARSESLLRNILPDAIAARLKDGESIIADGYDEATVLFADIVGFTPLSARLSPQALVARLNEVFTAFDARCAELGLEKIKTIGDAYMVVGGVPSKRADHAAAVVKMALLMRDVLAEQRERHGDSLDIRVGVHSGPVVAGVIGTRKFAFDVWGDTVNTASRMESHARPGHVQISERTRALIEERFELEDRGEIDVKGKGPMRTWFVLRERS